MKQTAFVLLLSLWAFQKVEAAAAPAVNCISLQPAGIRLPAPTVVTAKKPTRLQQLQYKRLQRKLHRYALRHKAAQDNGRLLSTLAIIAAGIAIGGFFISSVGVILVGGLVALILGLIALSKKEASKGTKVKSIFAVVIGGLLAGIGILAALISSLLSFE